ncbi:hypothetical protein ACMZ77_00510 [Gardnerella vaginalis]
MKVKRKYSIVSGCLVVALGCMCGLSACGESVQNSGTVAGSVNNVTNHSKNVTLRETVIACNIPESNVIDNGAFSDGYALDMEYIDPDDDDTHDYSKEMRSKAFHLLTKDIPCILRGLNHDDPKALELASKIERKLSKCNPDNLKDYLKENNLSFINYVGRSYVMMLRVEDDAVEFRVLSFDNFNKYFLK